MPTQKLIPTTQLVTMEAAHDFIERNRPDFFTPVPITNAGGGPGGMRLPLMPYPERARLRPRGKGPVSNADEMLQESLYQGLFLRSAFANSFLDGRKDINTECGYPQTIMIQQYRELYDREGIARRVVNLLPKESWALPPDLYESEDASKETAFEGAWRDLNNRTIAGVKLDMWHWCQRVDDISGIGQYGILLLGLDDARDWSEPVEGIDEQGNKVGNEKHSIIFMRAFDESVTRVKFREMDPTNPRFGLPTMYTVLFIDLGITGIAQGTDIISKDIHWSRIIHVADNRKMSEVYGIPRMQPVYNRLLDLRKILSGSGEMFWKGAFPGISFEVNPDLVDQGATVDAESMKKEMNAYEQGLKRWIATTGVTAKSLQIQVSSPKDHIEANLKSIAMTIGVPWTVFSGEEAAKLSQGGDSPEADAWNARLRLRQRAYITPFIINPLVHRLTCFGILPETKDGHELDWPDLNAPTDQDRAAIALQKTQALAAYVAGGVDQLIEPHDYLTMILDMTPDEADQVMKGAEAHAADHPHPNPEEQPGATATQFTTATAPKEPPPPPPVIVQPNGKPAPGGKAASFGAKAPPFGKAAPKPGVAGAIPLAKATGAKAQAQAKPAVNMFKEDDEDEEDDEETENAKGGKIKPGPAPKPGTTTSPANYPGGMGQPMPPYSIPPGAGVGGGTPAVPISGQVQRATNQGTKHKQAWPQKAPAVNPQGRPGRPQTRVGRGAKVTPGNVGGSTPDEPGTAQRPRLRGEAPDRR